MHTNHDNLSDAALVALVLNGQREAFAPLLNRHLPGVLRLCVRLLGSNHAAQDIAQDAMLAAFIGLHSLTEPGRFGAWLHAIAANLARMELRKRRPLSLEAMLGTYNGTLLWASTLPTPEDVSAARELHDAIIAALCELSPANRDVAVGYFLEGYSYAELAELLGVPLSTIKGRLFKSRRQLQQHLAPLAAEYQSAISLRKELAMSNDDHIAVSVAEIRMSSWSDHRVLILQSHDKQAIPIWIGRVEADAIANHLSGCQPTRPMTHDLTLRMLAPLATRIERVVINAITNHTFFAEIRLDENGKTHIIDARPSDAIALAVRCAAPIFVSRSVYESCARPDMCDSQETSTFAVKQIEAAASPFDPPLLYLMFDLARSAGFELDAANEYDWEAREVQLDGNSYTSVRLPGDTQCRLLIEPATWEILKQRMSMMTEARRELEKLMLKV